jgi:hypothetical protein
MSRLCAHVPHEPTSDVEWTASDLVPIATPNVERISVPDLLWTTATDVEWTATGHERPVFLDEHGRRRRWVWLGGALTGGASALWLGALIAGAIGFSSMPSLQASHPGSALLASRGAARHATLAERHHRRRAAAHPNPHPALGGATELAVSRALIAAR